MRRRPRPRSGTRRDGVPSPHEDRRARRGSSRGRLALCSRSGPAAPTRVRRPRTPRASRRRSPRAAPRRQRDPTGPTCAHGLARRPAARHGLPRLRRPPQGWVKAQVYAVLGRSPDGDVTRMCSMRSQDVRSPGPTPPWPRTPRSGTPWRSAEPDRPDDAPALVGTMGLVWLVGYTPCDCRGLPHASPLRPTRHLDGSEDDHFRAAGRCASPSCLPFCLLGPGGRHRRGAGDARPLQPAQGRDVQQPVRTDASPRTRINTKLIAHHRQREEGSQDPDRVVELPQPRHRQCADPRPPARASACA